MNQKPLFFFVYTFSFFSLLQAMDESLPYKQYSYAGINQIFPINSEEVIINTDSKCSIRNLSTGQEAILLEYDPRHYRELIIHPNPEKSLIALSDHESIIVYNYKTEEKKVFKTTIVNHMHGGVSYAVINRCIFHPRDTMIFFHRLVSKDKNLFCLDYSSEQIKLSRTIVLDKLKDFYPSIYCVKGNFISPNGHKCDFDPCPDKSILYIEEIGHRIYAFDLNSSNFTPVTKNKNKNKRLYSHYPSFCKVTADGNLLVALNYKHTESRHIDIFKLKEKGRLQSIISSNSFFYLALHPSLPVLAAVPENGLLEYWHIPSQKCIGEISLKKIKSFSFLNRNEYSFSFYPDGTKLVLLDDRRDILIISVPSIFTYKDLISKYFLFTQSSGLLPEIKRYIFKRLMAVLSKQIIID